MTITASRRIWLGSLLLAILGIGSLSYWRSVPTQPGVDFYQFWGIVKAQRESGFNLSSPYRNPEAYQRQLQGMAIRSGELELDAALASRQVPDLTGTPLLYYMFGSLPKSYHSALWGYRAAQVAAFIAAVFLILVLQGTSRISSAVFSVTLAFAFDPLLLDLACGNLNCLQLLGLTLLGLWVERYRGAVFPSAAVAGVMAGATLLTLIKPNVAAATFLLCCSVLSLANGRARLAGLASTILAIFVLAWLPSITFNSSTLWTDWWHGPVSGIGSSRYLLDTGNYSTVALLSRLFKWSVGTSAELVALSLATTAIGVTAFRFARSRLPLTQWAVCEGKAAIATPFLAIGLGLVALLSISPMVWSHYLILLLLPTIWMCGRQDSPKVATIFAWLALLLLTDLPRRIYGLMGGFPMVIIDLCRSLAWFPLWISLLNWRGSGLHAR